MILVIKDSEVVMIKVREIKDSFLHLLFPHLCAGCGSDSLSFRTQICMRCMHLLPETNFAAHANNPIEKIFAGRLPLLNASAQFYFTKESLMQQLIHQFKYKGNKALGLQLGQMIGDQLQRSGRFSVDALVPLPLFPMREKKRGFNQATILCEGIAAVLKVPVLDKVVMRTEQTETQTKKGRMERWQNMEGKFVLSNKAALDGKHLLLVDDVVTTGATLEACGLEMLKANNASLSIVTLCAAQ